MNHNKHGLNHHNKHGFPPQVPLKLQRAYAQHGIKQLFQWQTECLNDSTLFQPYFSNLIYSAPTSAGKTLVAEILAACNCLSTGRRALFVLPYISSAREKLLYLQSLWRSLNLVVKPFIGASSASIHGWSASVCTIEKTNALLNALIESELTSEIGIVVIDELHMLYDQDRGAIIENLLAKLLFLSKQNSSNAKIQLIGMSATLGGDESHKLLADWLSARIFITNFRPLILKEFWLDDEGQIFTLDLHSSCAGNEIITKIDRKLSEKFLIKGDNKCMIGITVEALINDQSVLIFCSTKAECEQSAILLAKYLKYCIDKGDSNRFPELFVLLQSSKLIEASNYFHHKTGCTERDLIHCVGQGVAYHHAGLTAEEREEIETLYRSGYIRVLVSTSTLSSGVNLPAHRVLIRVNGNSLIPLTSITYNQMVGRAGRQGQTNVSAGESYLLCSKKDWPTIQRQIQRKLFTKPSRPMSRLLLECINSQLCQTQADLHLLITECTFSHQTCLLQSELNELINLKLIAKCDNINDKIAKNGEVNCQQDEIDTLLLDEKTLDQVQPTQLGRAVLASSLDLRTAIQVFDGLELAMQSLCLDSELHMLFLVTPINNLAINENAINWNFFHEQWAHLTPELRRVANRIGISEEFFMQKLAGRTFQRGHSMTNVHIRFLASLILFELINEKPLQDVADQWRINRGLLQALQQQAATYAYMIVSFCDRLGWIHLRTLLDGFAERLQFGIRRDLTELVRIEGIDAIRARAFHQHGINSLVALANCSVDKILIILRKAVPFTLNIDEDKCTNTNSNKNTWLHGEPAMDEITAAKLLVERAIGIVQEQIRIFSLPSLLTITDQRRQESRVSLDLSLRFDSSCLNISLLDEDDEMLTSNDKALISDDDSHGNLSALDDLSASVLDEGWLTDDDDQAEENTNKQQNNDIAKAETCGKFFSSQFLENLQQKHAATTIDVSKADCHLVTMNELCETMSPLRLKTNNNLQVFCKSQNHNPNKKLNKTTEKNYHKSDNTNNKLAVFDDNLKENIPPLNKSNIAANDNDRVESNVKAINKKLKKSWSNRISAANNWLQPLVHGSSSSTSLLHSPLPKRKPQLTSSINTSSNQMYKCKQQQKEPLLSQSQTQPQYLDIYKRSAQVVAEMGHVGMHLHQHRANKMIERIMEHMTREEEEIFMMANQRFNLESAAEVSKILFVKLQLNLPEHIVNNSNSNFACYRRHLPTSSAVLNQISHPICERIGRWRKLENALTNLRSILAAASNNQQEEDSRVHTHFDTAGTSTGRILCHNPNLQFVPKRPLLGKYSVRSVFTAPPERMLLTADYSQLELRILCALSGDQALADVLKCDNPFELIANQFTTTTSHDAKNDIDKKHKKASRNENGINITREKAKQLCYAIIYGMGAKNLSKELRLSGGADDARQLIERFFRLFPKVKNWLSKTVERCKQNDGYVETYFGNRKKFNLTDMDNDCQPGLGGGIANDAAAVGIIGKTNRGMSVITQQLAMERRCVNFVIQGTASELFRLAMINVDAGIRENLHGKAQLMMQLHDELIVEVDEEYVAECALLMRECMQNIQLCSAPDGIQFPVKLAAGKDWGSLTTFHVKNLNDIN